MKQITLSRMAQAFTQDLASGKLSSSKLGKRESANGSHHSESVHRKLNGCRQQSRRKRLGSERQKETGASGNQIYFLSFRIALGAALLGISSLDTAFMRARFTDLLGVRTARSQSRSAGESKANGNEGHRKRKSRHERIITAEESRKQRQDRNNAYLGKANRR
jgi:hypothetical protein